MAFKNVEQATNESHNTCDKNNLRRSDGSDRERWL